jgi:hypothetical protein
MSEATTLSHQPTLPHWLHTRPLDRFERLKKVSDALAVIALLGFRLLILDHIDAHFTERDEKVLDLVRGGENGVDLVVSSVTSFFTALIILRTGGVGKV